jgi:hypothetical protein
MEFLVRHIQRTADIAGGFIVGTLVIEDGVFIQLEDGQMIPATGSVEVKNGDTWQILTPADFVAVTVEGWPAYAGLDARMK